MLRVTLRRRSSADSTVWRGSATVSPATPAVRTYRRHIERQSLSLLHAIVWLLRAGRALLKPRRLASPHCRTTSRSPRFPFSPKPVRGALLVQAKHSLTLSEDSLRQSTRARAVPCPSSSFPLSCSVDPPPRFQQPILVFPRPLLVHRRLELTRIMYCRFSRNRSGSSAAADYVDRDTDDYDARPSKNQSHNPTRPVDKEKAEAELQVALKKATNPDETAPKQKHVRSESSQPKGSSRRRAVLISRSASVRGHRLHVGLPHVELDLGSAARPARHVGRDPDVQGAHHRPQGLARGPPSRT